MGQSAFFVKGVKPFSREALKLVQFLVGPIVDPTRVFVSEDSKGCLLYTSTPQGGKTILVIGGAGGVGSITLQLLRALTEMRVIATASRPETKEWVRQCGAHDVLDHRHPLAPQAESLGIGAPGFVFSTTQTDKHLADIVTLIAPQGRFGLIDDPKEFDIKLFKLKALSLHCCLLYTSRCV